MKKKQKKNVLKVLCPFCNAPYKAEMLETLYYVSAGCPSCGSGDTAKILIEITCSNCERVVYCKETTVEYT